jgi:hypothetical protein
LELGLQFLLNFSHEWELEWESPWFLEQLLISAYHEVYNLKNNIFNYFLIELMKNNSSSKNDFHNISLIKLIS